MIHDPIEAVETLNSSAHYGVSTTGDGDVLVQLDDGINQVRVKLTSTETKHLRDLLFNAYFKAWDETLDGMKKFLTKRMK